MAIWDFRPKGDILTGVAVGVGVLTVPVVMPLAWSAVRPLVKAILKGGFMLYETGRRACAEVSGASSAEEIGTAKPEKPSKAEASTKATTEKKQVLEHESKHIEEVGSGEAQAKPAQPRPRRQAKPTKKKPATVKEKQT